MEYPTFMKGLAYAILSLLMPVWAFSQCGVISSSPTVPLCQNEPVTFTVQTTNTISGWSTSTTFDFSSGIVTSYPTNNNTISFENGFAQNVFVKVHLVGCADPDPIFAVNVVSPVVGNIISSETSTITCDTSYPILITGNQNPESISSSLYVWQSSFDQNNWQNIPLSNSANYSIISPPSQSTYIRRIINSLACDNSISNVLYFEVVNPPNGGTLSGGGAFCHSEQPVLELSGYSGTISTWEYSSNGTNFTPISGTANLVTYTPDLLPGTHYLRVLVENPGCESLYSTQAIVTKYAEISNEILTPDQAFCSAQIPENIHGNQPSGGGNSPLSVLWQKKTISAGVWQNISNTQFTVTTLTFSQPVQETTFFRRLASSDLCEFDISDSVGVFIYPETQAGSFTSSEQIVCPDDEIQPIVLQGHVGSITDWFSSPTPVGPWTSLNHTEASYTPGGDTGSVHFRALVQSANCEQLYTTVYHLNILPEITQNIIQQNQLLCSGETPAQLTGAFPQGGNGLYNILWQQKTESSDWVNAEGVNNQLHYTPSILDETHYFRRIVSSGNCLESISNTVEVIMHEPPTGILIGGGMICPGESAQISVFFQGTPPFTIEFNDGNEFFTTDGINNSEHIITVDTDVTTIYTLTGVTDAYCTSTIEFEPSSVTITPIPSPDYVSAGMDMYVCGLTAQLSGSSIDDNYHENFWSDDQGNILSFGADFTFEADQAGVYDLTYNVDISGCTTLVSSTITVTLDQQETANAGENQQICSTSTELSATAVEVGTGHWIIPQGLSISNAFDPAATLSGMAHGQNYQLIWVAESIENICPNDTSVVTVQVDDHSSPGMLNASSESICAGELVFLQISDQNGDVIQWIFNDSDGTQTVNSNQASVETGNLIADTEVMVVVQSGTCPADTSNSVFITVNEPAVPGSLSEDMQVCIGENSGTIEISGFTGEVVFWEISEDNFQTSEVIYSAQTSYSFQNLENTTYFRTNVQSGSCPSVYSNSVTVEVLESIELFFDLDDSYCSSSEAISLHSLIEGGESGEWSINGVIQSTFDPSLYGNSEVNITYTNNINGCGGSFTQTTSVDELPEIWTNVSALNCGLSAIAEAGVSVGSVQWISDSGLFIDESGADGTIQLTASSFGTYSVTYIAQNGVCSASETIEITFTEQPSEAHAGEDQFLEFTFTAQLNANLPEVGTGTWSAESADLSFSDIQDPKAIVYHLKPGKNILYWTITNGNCPISSAKVVIDVSPLVVPNAFSPNGDHVNDLFEISGIDAVSPVDIKVWNRWGVEVYTSSNYQNTWDGRNLNGNELPSDTYYYLIKTPAMNEVLKGFIVLQR